MMSASIFRKIIGVSAAVILAAGLWACAGAAPGNDGTPETEGTEEGRQTGSERRDTIPLPQFCADEELNAWFDALNEHPPVKMDYIVYGYGPYSGEIKDPDLIMQTALALQTVQIDGPAGEDPDLVNDAGGYGYSFETEDGRTFSFSFVMGAFRWGDSGWHAVADTGALRDLNEQLEAIINPPYTYTHSEDGGFGLRHPESCETAWVDEGQAFGGLRILLDASGAMITVSRVDAEPQDPAAYLQGTVQDTIEKDLEEIGCALTGEGKLIDFKAGSGTMPCMLYPVKGQDGGDQTLLVLILRTRDSLMGEEHLVRFNCFSDPASEQAAEHENIFREAIRSFNLSHMYYLQGEVRPGSTLPEFCGDPGLNEWYQRALEKIPDELTYNADTWYVIDDPETVRKVLEALQTVRIGGVSQAHVGGSGRQLFDFCYHSGGNNISFWFFQDTFFYDGKSYDVLDWGDLKNMDLKKAASYSGG